MVERAHNCFLATVEFNPDCVTLGKRFNECLWALPGLSLYYICCIIFWKGKGLTAKTWGFSRCPVMCKAFCSSQTFEQTPWSQHITGEWGQPGVSEHLVFWRSEKERLLGWINLTSTWVVYVWPEASHLLSLILRSFICKRMIIGWLSRLNQCMMSAYSRSSTLVFLWPDTLEAAGRFLCRPPS